MFHNFFIYSSVDEHLGCFHVLAIVNSAALNNGIYVSVSICFLKVYALEKGITTHCSTLAWKMPWTEQPGGLQSVGVAKSRT